MQDIYGVLVNGVHIDVSQSALGAKRYANKHGYNTITLRYNCGYIAMQVAMKVNGKWINI